MLFRSKPVPNEELEKFRTETGVFASLFETCVSFTEDAARTSLERAVKYAIRIPSTAVVACKYSVPFKAIDDAVCLVNPLLGECQNEDTNSP